MLARLQRFITIALLCAAGVWFIAFEHVGRTAWGLLGALIIAFGYALVLGLEFLLLSVTRGQDPTPKANATQMLRAWWIEALTAPMIFCWRQPFRTNSEPDVPAVKPGRRGLLMVHGLVCNRAFWNPWLTRLRGLRIPTIAISMEPVFGSIEAYASSIESAVCELEASTGLAPVIVAHSMGGLAVRAWLRERAAYQRVHHIVTIGTPHGGTWLARLGHGVGAGQMAMDSPWLRTLQAGEPPELARQFTCFYSHCDNVVFPPARATLRGADNRHVPGCSHVHLAFVDPVFDEVIRIVGVDDRAN